MTQDTGGEEQRQPLRLAWFRRTSVRIGLAVIGLVAVAGGILWWLNARQYVSTDDAFIDTHIAYIAPQIAGRIKTIYVTDNEMVRVGQKLADIDPASARAQYQQAQAQKEQAETALAEAKAQAKSAAAKTVQANQDLKRYRALQRHDSAAVSRLQMDSLVAAARTAAANQNAAEQQIAGAKAQIKVAKARLATSALNLSYTKIVAPVAGHVTKRNIAIGDYVSPGQDMMAIVPLKLWVTANFKESEINGMHKGDPATISIDACGGDEVKGHVNSIQRGAGQAFQILPPENATGNFVKVVQRVPVKIVLDSLPRDCVIGPGMSVEPTVKVR